jgi:hypothetical protein
MAEQPLTLPGKVKTPPEGKRPTPVPPSVEQSSNEEQPHRQQKPTLERFRLQVDGQTKSSYSTGEPAVAAGAAIKKKFPIVHVTVL